MPEELTEADVTDPEVVSYVRDFQRLIDHYLIGTTVLNTKIHQGSSWHRVQRSFAWTRMAERALEKLCIRAGERVAFGKPLAAQGVVRVLSKVSLRAEMLHVPIRDMRDLRLAEAALVVLRLQ